MEKVVEPPSPPGPPESELLGHAEFVIAVFAPPPPPPAPPKEDTIDPVDPCAAHAPIWFIGVPIPNVEIMPLLTISFPATIAMDVTPDALDPLSVIPLLIITLPLTFIVPSSWVFAVYVTFP